MAHGTIEKGDNISSVLTLPDQGKNGVKGFNISIDQLRRMLRTNIGAIGCEIPFFQHFLRNERFVLQSPRTLESKACKGRKSPMVNTQAMLICQLLPLLPDIETC